MKLSIKEIEREVLLILLANLVKIKIIRQIGIKVAEKKLWKKIIEDTKYNYPAGVQEDKYYFAVAYLNALARGIKKGLISEKVLTNLAPVIDKIYANNDKEIAFEESHGFKAPQFLTISPTKACNLKCKGCYASSSDFTRNKLDYGLIIKIITEQRELWGRHFTVISGGEPFVYRDNGKDIIDLAAEFPDHLFLVYTNGTLISKKVAARLADIGNITPAISVEGFERETDERRGEGTFKKILAAMENLREVGVPFGLSVTATRNNYKTVVSDEFYEYFMDQQGAIYAWIFHYMPIGRSFTVDLMPTPEERLYMWMRERELVREQKRLLADFWNGGPLSNGCICSGRPRTGYFHIDWNGNIMPCVFIPYYTHNIKNIYQSGDNLNSILSCPFYDDLRKWHHSYIDGRPPEKMGNMLAECAIRDHNPMLKRIVQKNGAHSEDEAATQAISDPEYAKRMRQYGRRLKQIMDPIWETYYQKRKLVYKEYN
jgi:MoaA/NifB/PqqE/SkfB family radical SAM enzyme